jgi:hypothetical protein
MPLSQAVAIFSSQLIVNEVQVIQNLAEYAKRTPRFHELLLELIEFLKDTTHSVDYSPGAYVDNINSGVVKLLLLNIDRQKATIISFGND